MDIDLIEQNLRARQLRAKALRVLARLALRRLARAWRGRRRATLVGVARPAGAH